MDRSSRHSSRELKLDTTRQPIVVLPRRSSKPFGRSWSDVTLRQYQPNPIRNKPGEGTGVKSDTWHRKRATSEQRLIDLDRPTLLIEDRRDIVIKQAPTATPSSQRVLFLNQVESSCNTGEQRTQSGNGTPSAQSPQVTTTPHHTFEGQVANASATSSSLRFKSFLKRRTRLSRPSKVPATLNVTPHRSAAAIQSPHMIASAPAYGSHRADSSNPILSAVAKRIVSGDSKVIDQFQSGLPSRPNSTLPMWSGEGTYSSRQLRHSLLWDYPVTNARSSAAGLEEDINSPTLETDVSRVSIDSYLASRHISAATRLDSLVVHARLRTAYEGDRLSGHDELSGLPSRPDQKVMLSSRGRRDSTISYESFQDIVAKSLGFRMDIPWSNLSEYSGISSLEVTPTARRFVDGWTDENDLANDPLITPIRSNSKIPSLSRRRTWSGLSTLLDHEKSDNENFVQTSTPPKNLPRSASVDMSQRVDLASVELEFDLWRNRQIKLERSRQMSVLQEDSNEGEMCSKSQLAESAIDPMRSVTDFGMLTKSMEEVPMIPRSWLDSAPPDLTRNPPLDSSSPMKPQSVIDFAFKPMSSPKTDPEVSSPARSFGRRGRSVTLDEPLDRSLSTSTKITSDMPLDVAAGILGLPVPAASKDIWQYLKRLRKQESFFSRPTKDSGVQTDMNETDMNDVRNPNRREECNPESVDRFSVSSSNTFASANDQMIKDGNDVTSFKTQIRSRLDQLIMKHKHLPISASLMPGRKCPSPFRLRPGSERGSTEDVDSMREDVKEPITETILNVLDMAIGAEETFSLERQRLENIARRQSSTIEMLLKDKEVLAIEIARLKGLVELLATDHNDYESIEPTSPLREDKQEQRKDDHEDEVVSKLMFSRPQRIKRPTLRRPGTATSVVIACPGSFPTH